MGLTLAADFDFKLAFDGLNKRLEDYQQALERYLQKPHGDIRQLFSTIPAPSAATPPAVIDLGAPGGGLLWSVQQVCVIGGSTISSSAISNVSGAIFVGGVPGAAQLAGALDFSQLSSSFFTIPTAYQAGGKSLIARANQHIYVLVAGSGITGQGFSVSATVLQVPDTTEALLWL